MPPIYTLGEEGVTAIEIKIGAIVKVTVPEAGPAPAVREAVMFVVPRATPVATPEADIVAFEVSDEVQVTILEISAVEVSE